MYQKQPRNFVIMSFLQLLVSLQEKEKITKDEEDINQGRDKIPTNHTFHVS